MHGFASYLWYETTYIVSGSVLTLGFSLRTEGRLNVPRKGPVLLIANHSSSLDPVLVGLSTRRHLRFLARKTLFAKPLVGALLRSLRAIPIDLDGSGREGLQAILDELLKGEAVLVFPEGTRTDDGNMSPFKPGIQFLIKRARPAIVPVGIAGAFEAWPYWKPLPKLSPLIFTPTNASIAVSVGKPLDGNIYAEMSREDSLVDLFDHVYQAKQNAENLRRRK